MTFHDIFHQITCAYAPQQNGMVEHKNNHLLETTHTLLIHVRFLNVFGVMLFLLHIISLIPCHLQF